MGISTSSVMSFDLPRLIQIDIDVSSLIEPFTTTEIDKIVSSLPLDKAPARCIQWYVHEKVMGANQE
jgi:hypothetical protein